MTSVSGMIKVWMQSVEVWRDWKKIFVHVFCDSPAPREERDHRSVSQLRFPPHCVGFSTALCWHTHLTISLSSCSLLVSSLTPVQWILLGPQALISLPLFPNPRFCFITRLFRERAEKIYLRAVTAKSMKKYQSSVWGIVKKCSELYYKLPSWITVICVGSSKVWSWHCL